MKNALLALFTDGTNEDLDYAKVGGALVLFVFLGISSYFYVFKDSAFNPIEWATGATIIVGIATGVSKLRDATVPPADSKSQ